MCLQKPLIWLTFLSTLLLIACSEKRIQSDIAPVTIRFAVPGYRQVVYEDLVDAFEQENPGIHVKG